MKLMTEEKKDFKITDVGLIPEDWEVYDLGKTSTLKARIGWQGLRTDEYLESGSYYLVTGTDFKNGRIDWDQCYFVDKVRYDQDRNIQLKEDDILITKDGTIGKVALVRSVPKPATLNSGVFVIRPRSNEYIPKYLYYLFQGRVFKSFLDQLTAGSTINHLYQKDFVNFKYPTPSTLAEQQAIASALSDVDELIRSLDGLIKKKQGIKKGTMQQLLTSKKRLPGFNGEWEEVVLGNIGNFRKGKGIKKSEVINKGQPCIRYGELYTKHHEVIKSFESFISSETASLSTEIKTGDILFAGSGETKEEIGKCAVYVNDDIAYAGGDIIIFTPRDNISPLLLGYFLNTYDVNKQKSSMAQGDAVVHIYSKHLANLRFAIPPSIEEQKAIAQILSDMDRELQTLRQKREKYVQIKQGMMQELLTGRVRLV